jgi:hypothetical protein
MANVQFTDMHTVRYPYFSNYLPTKGFWHHTSTDHHIICSNHLSICESEVSCIKLCIKASVTFYRLFQYPVETKKLSEDTSRFDLDLDLSLI